MVRNECSVIAYGIFVPKTTSVSYNSPFSCYWERSYEYDTSDAFVCLKSKQFTTDSGTDKYRKFQFNIEDLQLNEEELALFRQTFQTDIVPKLTLFAFTV